MKKTLTWGWALLLTLAACKEPTAPPVDHSAYYQYVCTAAGMRWLEGTRTCVGIGSDSSYINLQPPK